MKNLKVGTLTFHEAGSYGAVFQSYALQQALLDMGEDTEIINYRCPAIWKYREKTINIKNIIGHLLRFPWRNRKLRKFDDFRKNILKCSDQVAGQHEIKHLCEKYDKVIVGSDQVWNPDLTGNDRAYFLDFMEDDKKKISYAASIGTDSWKENEKELGDLVSRFESLSVREKSAAAYLERLMDIKAEIVCDPTFLISDDKWNSIIKEPSFKDEYILIYMLGKEYTGCLDWCKKLAREKGYKIIMVHGNRKKGDGCVNVRDASPQEMLGLLKRAQFVATNSFHGICMSMIFQKNFVWFREKGEPGNLKERGSRIRDLLEGYNLVDREVSIDSLPPSDIDKEKLHSDIVRFRQVGLQWLKQALK